MSKGLMKERTQKTIRMGEKTPMIVAYYAARCGLLYGNKGSIGLLLDVISNFRGKRLDTFTQLIKNQMAEDKENDRH
ncbi:hypothetical protein N836_31555 [Leptolyngbya sp. Heron Island J]|nr:hypothetical protein N836_31555 [Leptolyngbya sp. Heron Island J]